MASPPRENYAIAQQYAHFRALGERCPRPGPGERDFVASGLLLLGYFYSVALIADQPDLALDEIVAAMRKRRITNPALAPSPQPRQAPTARAKPIDSEAAPLHQPHTVRSVRFPN